MCHLLVCKNNSKGNFYMSSFSVCNQFKTMWQKMPDLQSARAPNRPWWKRGKSCGHFHTIWLGLQKTEEYIIPYCCGTAFFREGLRMQKRIRDEWKQSTRVEYMPQIELPHLLNHQAKQVFANVQLIVNTTLWELTGWLGCHSQALDCASAAVLSDLQTNALQPVGVGVRTSWKTQILMRCMEKRNKQG